MNNEEYLKLCVEITDNQYDCPEQIKETNVSREPLYLTNPDNLKFITPDPNRFITVDSFIKNEEKLMSAILSYSNILFGNITIKIKSYNCVSGYEIPKFINFSAFEKKQNYHSRIDLINDYRFKNIIPNKYCNKEYLDVKEYPIEDMPNFITQSYFNTKYSIFI